jgi:hypothetical protein
MHAAVQQQQGVPFGMGGSSSSGSYLAQQQQQQPVSRVSLHELQQALAKSDKPLPELLTNLLGSLGLMKPDTITSDQRQQQQQQAPLPPPAAAAAAAAAGSSQSGRPSRKRSASSAGFSEPPAKTTPGRQRRDRLAQDGSTAAAAAAAAGSAGEDNAGAGVPDPAAAAVAAAAAGAAAALGVAGDANRASVVDQMLVLLRERGLNTSEQVGSTRAEVTRDTILCNLHDMQHCAIMCIVQDTFINTRLQQHANLSVRHVLSTTPVDKSALRWYHLTQTNRMIAALPAALSCCFLCRLEPSLLPCSQHCRRPAGRQQQQQAAASRCRQRQH